jgi:hypothetical protein
LDTLLLWVSSLGSVNRSQRFWAKEFINAGADIIVGHGAHMIQEIEHIRGRPVIYSLGNFIFNSNGEYRKRNVPPYSFLFRLKAKIKGNELLLSHDLQTIFCANHECGFQPYIIKTGT